MNLSKQAIKRTVLATAMTAALGIPAIPEQVSAAQLTFSFTGWFTMINGTGLGNLVNSDAGGPPMYGNRTPVIGTMVFDDATNSGTMNIDPFSFFGSGFATATGIAFEDIDGVGGAGTLLLTNMGFDWNSNNGIPVSLAWDAQGLLDAIGQGLTVGNTIATTGADFACDTNIVCATPATDDFAFTTAKGATYTLPMGAGPVVTTTWNTTDIGAVTLGSNPSGTLPLIADTVGGSPMKAGPFPGFNANFDIANMALTSDGSGSITAPADINDTVPQTPPPPGRTQSVNLGAPTGVSPAPAEYCLTGKPDCDTNGWITDNGTNAITVPVDQTVNTLVADWRTNDASAFDTQNVTVTVNDTTAPTIDTTPMDVSFDVQSVSDNVCFSTDAIGHLTATDVWDPSPAIEYSLDGFTFFPSNPSPGEDCSDDFPPGTSFGPNANTVIWRTQDEAGNSSTYNQTVTLNLPSGIVGKECEVNLDYAGVRNTEGDFTMLNPTGAQVEPTDTGVTGVIDTTLLCTDSICTDVGATLNAGQAFQGLLWKAEPINLYGPGDWTFDACPGDDQSTQCDGDPQPRLLSMTVKTAIENRTVQQLGAHMLFAWGSTNDIDVVVVWDVDCGSKQLTTTDPDGDGILGTKMVDGPFIGFNAVFDISATGVDPDGNSVPLIADGGYLVSIPAYQNPVPKSSPLALTASEIPPGDMPADSAATRSCVGGCYTFETDDLQDGVDGNGAYKFTRVVLPLNEPIPFWSLYRKFDSTTNQWRAYTLDDRNDVKSAPFDASASGLCPEPGAGDYKVAATTSVLADKLEAGDNCIQLTIEDNGPNDSNAVVGTVADPSGVAEVSAPPLKDPDTENDFFDAGCTISKTAVDPMKRADWWLLGGLLGWLSFRAHGKRSRS